MRGQRVWGSTYTPFLLYSSHLSTRAESPDQLHLSPEGFDVAFLWKSQAALANQSGTENAVYGLWGTVKGPVASAVKACDFQNTKHGSVSEPFPSVPKADETHTVCHPPERGTKESKRDEFSLCSIPQNKNRRGSPEIVPLGSTRICEHPEDYASILLTLSELKIRRVQAQRY